MGNELILLSRFFFFLCQCFQFFKCFFLLFPFRFLCCFFCSCLLDFSQKSQPLIFPDFHIRLFFIFCQCRFVFDFFLFCMDRLIITAERVFIAGKHFLLIPVIITLIQTFKTCLFHFYTQLYNLFFRLYAELFFLLCQNFLLLDFILKQQICLFMLFFRRFQSPVEGFRITGNFFYFFFQNFQIPVFPGKIFFQFPQNDDRFIPVFFGDCHIFCSVFLGLLLILFACRLRFLHEFFR